VEVTFNGTSVTWMAYRDEWSGLAQVFIDGVLQSTVDTYMSPSKAQTPAFSMSGLAPGTHVLKIVAMGTHGAASAGSWIWVDGFQVSGSVTAGPPAISTGGFVSAASFEPAPRNQVAPGQIVSIFGQNFLASGSASASALPLPPELGPLNTTVTACGRAIPLYNVFSRRFNAQIPLECADSGVVTARITVGGQTSTQTFTLAPARRESSRSAAMAWRWRDSARG
jgi:hypothetical protein